MTLYLMWESLILYNLFTSIYIGPGTVPFDWEPVSILMLHDIYVANHSNQSPVRL